MSVVIRMKRAGAKKRPFFRVVVTDSRNPRDGRYIEQLGYYDPLTDPATFRIDADRFSEWIRRGALPSESVGVMVSKHAPEALRPAPLVIAEPAPAEAKPQRAKASKAKTATKKTAKKPKAPTKASEKKAKSRAKAKAKKASGGVKPKSSAKKAKK